MPPRLVRMGITSFFFLLPFLAEAQITISGIRISDADIGRAARVLRTARDVANAGNVIVRLNTRHMIINKRFISFLPAVFQRLTPQCD